MSNNSLDETNSVSRSDQVLMWFVVGSLTLIEFALVALVGWLIFASGITSVSWTGSIYATATPSIVASS
jgi:Tfp pilus assembly protein PilN